MHFEIQSTFNYEKICPHSIYKFYNLGSSLIGECGIDFSMVNVYKPLFWRAVADCAGDWLFSSILYPRHIYFLDFLYCQLQGRRAFSITIKNGIIYFPVFCPDCFWGYQQRLSQGKLLVCIVCCYGCYYFCDGTPLFHLQYCERK